MIGRSTSAASHMSKQAPRIAGRLLAARRGRFVGRIAEQALFRAALLTDPLPFAVLFVHGPSGVGKTSLLRKFARAADAGRSAVATLRQHLGWNVGSVLP